MSTVKPNELLKLWAQEKIPVEMAMGHVLQNLVLQQTAIDTINLTLYQIKVDVDSIRTVAPQSQQERGTIRKTKKL